MLMVVPRVYDLGETEEECGEVLSDTGPSLVLVPYLLLLKFIDSSKKMNTKRPKTIKTYLFYFFFGGGGKHIYGLLKMKQVCLVISLITKAAAVAATRQTIKCLC